MKKMMMIALTGLIAAPAFAYDSLEDLMKDFMKKQAVELKKYVAEHPQAEDAKTAEMILVQSLTMTGQREEAVGILEKKYEALLKNKDKAEVTDVLRGCIAPMLSALFDGGQKDKAKAFIERVEKDWADHASASQILRTAGQFKAKLNTPVVGDTMEIKLKTTDGKEFDLASMKGKVVLVDFWATWCGPCIQELPNVKKAYAAFKDKGFEIISISLDDDLAKLEAYVKKDGAMPWPHACSGDGWDDATAKKFGITGIPAMFLIGKDGKIAAVSPRGPGVLEKKLGELLGK